MITLEYQNINLNYYKKKVKKDGTIIITDYSFDMRGNEKWKKERWICNDSAGLKLVEHTKMEKSE